MTWPCPSGNENGCPGRFQEASNSLPSLKFTPSYWTVTVWPDFAAGPVPFLMSLITSLVGGSPPGTVIFGRSPSLPLTLTALPLEEPPLAAAGVAVSVAASVGSGVGGWIVGVGVPSLEELPHAANPSTASSRGRASRYRRMAAA